MKVLILEDDERRITLFKEKLVGHLLFTTDNPQKANTWLELESFDFVFLDHDLADEHYREDCDSNETTGLCTAEFLGNNPEFSPDAKIIVHSLNPSGRKRMMQALASRNAIEYPFNFLIGAIQVD